MDEIKLTIEDIGARVKKGTAKSTLEEAKAGV